MYSGITRGVYPVTAVEARPGVTRLSIGLTPALLADLACGASVSVDGVCLTVVAFDAHGATFEAIAETTGRTTLGELRTGSLVSIERSCRVGDELGGHDVFGHVIGTGRVRARNVVGEQLDLTIEVPPAWMKYILPKGFIALDGSSLTVSEARGADHFTVHLIPETVRLTKFGDRQVGDRVNVELDARTVAIVDTVERVLVERLAAGFKA